MDKIIVVGHPQSGIEKICKLLKFSGMKEPFLSKIERLNAQEITETILKSNNIDKVINLKNINKVDISPIWNTLVLDLILANTEQSVWGWGDSNAIHLLDYFNNLDKEILFVLVYDDPKSVISSDFSIDEQQVISDLESWVQYNEKIINFYNNNIDRCVLVSSSDLNNRGARIINSINDKLHNKKNINEGFSNRKNNSRRRNKISNNIKSEKLNIIEVEIDLDENNSNRVGSFFLNYILNERENIFYETLSELNSLTIFPLKKDETIFSNVDVWNSILFEKKELINKINSLEKEVNSISIQKEKDLSSLKESYKEIEKKAIWRANHIQELKKEKDSIEKKATWRANHIQELKKEKDNIEKKAIWRANRIQELNKISENSVSIINSCNEKQNLLSQIHMLQEELEEYYNQNVELKRLIKDEINISKNKKILIKGAVERFKKERSYRLGSVVVNSTKDLKGIVKLPLTLYMEVNRKLELPPLEDYIDKDEVESVKKHLSYRIGTLINNVIENPREIFNSPLKLYNEVVIFRNEKDKS